MILASRSPQRRAILDQLGVAYEVRPTDAEELTDGDPAEIALENARRKAAAARAAGAPAGAAAGPPVLACDTVVALDGALLGKPRDAREAQEFVQRLQGRAHEVFGGLVLGDRETVARTVVRFRTLTPAEAAGYVSTGEWRGRAGGYAIQGKGAALVTAIEGDYSNVVGLPIAALVDLAGDLR